MNLPAVQQQPYSMVPTSLEEAVKISAMLAKSDLVPKDFRGKPENVFVAMQWGTEIGLKPLQALQNIAVINGRPSVWGDAALAIVQNRSDCEDISETIEGEGDKRAAICTIKRKGRSPVSRSFSVSNAKVAGLWTKQGPWTQYPERMLQMRARGFAIRDAFPDALRGLNLAEELQGVEVDVTSVSSVVSREPLPQSGSERDITPQAQVHTERDLYSDAAFAENFPKWKSLIESGRKTADDIINSINSKAVLTEDQVSAIRELTIQEAQEQP